MHALAAACNFVPFWFLFHVCRTFFFFLLVFGRMMGEETVFFLFFPISSFFFFFLQCVPVQTDGIEHAGVRDPGCFC